MNIKILGSGCASCIKLAKNTEEALKETGVQAEVSKVEDFKEIMKYGVMSTPTLVINEKVVSVGKVLKTNDIVKLLKKVGE